MERLQKYISESGYTSRRKAEELILKGKVKVNGSVVKELGTKVTDADLIEIDNQILRKQDHSYFLLYKPRSVISSVTDDKGRKTVVDFFSSNKRLYIEEDVSGREVTNEYLQHCAAINSGNSGGGLFNIYGELIGINTWKVVGELSDNIEGLCFSIPSSVVLNTFAKYLR